MNTHSHVLKIGPVTPFVKQNVLNTLGAYAALVSFGNHWRLIVIPILNLQLHPAYIKD